jgi:hypothetical protein
LLKISVIQKLITPIKDNISSLRTLEAVPDSTAFQAAFVAAVRDTGDAVADASFVGSCLAVQAAASLLAARDVDAVGDIDTVAS